MYLPNIAAVKMTAVGDATGTAVGRAFQMTALET